MRREALAARRDFHRPGISGGMPLGKRPAGKRLLEIVRPGDIVIAARMDRCFRSALDALETIESLFLLRVSINSGGY
jgi:DNA invertase Pin-like site-specific DNA recombinase